MFKFGLKLWSTNDAYIPDAVMLFREGVYQYIELFVVPNSYDQWIELWQKLMKEEGIPFVIHAPHFMAGLNLSQKGLLESNIRMANESFRIADQLGSAIVIFHPGIGGKDEETVFQIKNIFDSRILIENKPYYPLNGINAVCNGYSPESIRYITSSARVGFCLDIGHAFCAANAQKEDKMTYLKRFLELKPKMFHLTDGDNDGIYDKHEHFGEGTYNLASVLDCLPEGAMITVETDKSNVKNLSPFINDLGYLRSLKAGVD